MLVVSEQHINPVFLLSNSLTSLQLSISSQTNNPATFQLLLRQRTHPVPIMEFFYQILATIPATTTDDEVPRDNSDPGNGGSCVVA
jgi:hypothetical protein